MRKFLVKLLSTILVIAASINISLAQDPACYVVSYFEVKSTEILPAIALIKDYAAGSRKETGNQDYKILQSQTRPTQFASLEKWNSKSLQQAHAKSEATTLFREAIAEVMVSGYDERIHTPLKVDNCFAEFAPDSLYTLTHVDIKPKVKNKGVALVKKLVRDSRNAEGNTCFDALTQADMTNHMTLVETWNSLDDKLLNSARPDIRSVRADLTKIIGGLYDERLYVVVDRN